MSKKIITRFGGVQSMAEKLTEALGKRVAPTTVRYWWEQGYIPIRRQADVAKAAEFHGIKIRTAEFAFVSSAV